MSRADADMKLFNSQVKAKCVVCKRDMLVDPPKNHPMPSYQRFAHRKCFKRFFGKGDPESDGIKRR